MIKTLFVAIVSVAVMLAAYLYFHLGVYKPVEIRLEKRGPFYLLFKQHVGPYHQLVPILQEVESWVKEHNLKCPQTFGEFLDNPEAVDEDRLRSHAGCVLDKPLATAPPEYLYQQRPEHSYVVGRFSGSPAIGPYKVYPKIRKFMEENRVKSSSPILELYTVNGTEVSTEYLFPVD